MFALVDNAGAQAFNAALITHFGNASCGICALQNPPFKNTILTPNVGKVHLIKVPTSFPGFNPMYSAIPAICNANLTYNNITSTPTAVINGNFKKSSLSNVTQSDINTINGQPSPIRITTSHTNIGQKRTVTVNITTPKYLNTLPPIPPPEYSPRYTAGVAEHPVRVYGAGLIDKSFSYSTRPGAFVYTAKGLAAAVLFGQSTTV
ncbi:MAG: hypothetical protein IPO27_14070 [Bacteroidetes bacterium]|nr:hypothetical protein [Bacteroidota bacterium]